MALSVVFIVVPEIVVLYQNFIIFFLLRNTNTFWKNPGVPGAKIRLSCLGILQSAFEKIFIAFYKAGVLDSTAPTCLKY